jgi:hypothetical protein
LGTIFSGVGCARCLFRFVVVQSSSGLGLFFDLEGKTNTLMVALLQNVSTAKNTYWIYM